MRSIRTALVALTTTLGAVVCAPVAASAQATGSPPPTIACADSSARGVMGNTACTIFARRPMPRVDHTPVAWTVESFSTRAAADRAATSTGAVVEMDQKFWLLTVGAHRAVPRGATRHLEIALPLPNADRYEMMLAYVAVAPGSRSAVHVQSGPEAWYVLDGSQCVETPDTVMHIDKGHGGLVPSDTPLFLVATGTTTRRAFFVIVHDAARQFYTEINTWKPRGLCGQDVSRP